MRPATLKGYFFQPFRLSALLRSRLAKAASRRKVAVSVLVRDALRAFPAAPSPGEIQRFRQAKGWLTAMEREREAGMKEHITVSLESCQDRTIHQYSQRVGISRAAVIRWVCYVYLKHFEATLHAD